MKKLVVLLILLVASLCTAGCSEKAQENSTNHENIQNNSTNHQNDFTNNQNNFTSSQNSQNECAVVEATKLRQINTSLQKNPILLEIGSEGCDDCQAMKPILAQIAAEYGDRVTVMSVDMDKSPKLADYFGAYVVPVSFVIIGIKNDNFTYMREDGNISMDEFKARIIGPRDKDVLDKILGNALQERKKFK